MWAYQMCAQGVIQVIDAVLVPSELADRLGFHGLYVRFPGK